jgi:hypothetical protein
MIWRSFRRFSASCLNDSPVAMSALVRPVKTLRASSTRALADAVWRMRAMVASASLRASAMVFWQTARTPVAMVTAAPLPSCAHVSSP